nr:DNA-directed DNA polymerase [Tanacetum cinerariifolium]
MSTRSYARNLFPPLDNPELTIRRRSRSDPTLLNNSKMAAEENGDLPVPDLRTMEELCQPSLNGRGGPIAIQATNFGLKNDMIQQVQNSCQFHGLPGGTFMKGLPEECYDLIENITAHHNDWDTSAQWSESSSSITSSFDTKIAALKAKMAKINKNLMRVLQPSLAILKTYMLQEPIKIPQPQVVTTNEFTNFMKFMKMNTASSSRSKTLPGNTITNSEEDLKGITTRSETAYPGPTIPTTSSPPVVERETEANKDTVHPTNNESTKDVQPQVFQSESLILNSEPVSSLIIEPVASPVSAPRPNQRPSIPYPSRLHDQKLRNKANDQREKFFQIFKDLNFNIGFADALILMPKFGPSIKSLLTNKDKLFELARTPLNEHCSAVLLKKFPEKLGDLAGRALIDVFEGKLTLHVGREAITFNLDQTSRYSANYNDMTANRIDVIDIACEEYSQEVLGFFNVIASGNPTPYYDPIVSTTSSTLTPFGNSDFLLEEEEILLLEAFLNDDPSLPSPNQGNYLHDVSKKLKIYEAKSDKSSIDEPPEVELKDLPPHLEYAFLEGDDKLPVIIAKDLTVEEKTALITVLKSHKRAIAWKLSDIKGIDPGFCTHEFLMEEDFEPVVQSQRRVNPKIQDVIKQEVLKLFDAGLIYINSNSPWVSPVHCVPKKGGFIVVENEENELILTCLVTGWRVCINYCKLKKATRKDHFPLLFHVSNAREISGNQYYCFLNGFSGYFQIPIDPKIRRKPHSLTHTERLLTAACLLGYAMHRACFREKMLKRCEDTNLCLNWEKSYFMVKEGIVLGHKISKERIEVNKSKVDVITKLPHPTTIKGIRSFLGHASFYHRFIKDFSKIARPMTRLLEKDNPFLFSKECVEAFQTFKRKLTEDPILIAPDWDMPFELMYDASDFAIGAVLGQRQDKHFRPIHYASNIMTEAESNYTTTEKEMLAVAK